MNFEECTRQSAAGRTITCSSPVPSEEPYQRGLELLGQKDVATTYMIYIHMIPEEMDEAVDAVGKVMMGE